MATQDRLPIGLVSGGSDGWTALAGGNKWEEVDDPIGSPDDATSYIFRSDSAFGQVFAITPFAITPSAIAKVTLTWRGQRTAVGALNGNAVLRVSTVNQVGTSQAMTTAWTTYTQDWLTNPATSANWLEADIEGSGTNPITGIGVTCGSMNAGEQIRVTQIYVTVEYTDAGSGAYTLTADGGSFAATGTAAGLLFGRRLVAASGATAITGTAATLKFGRVLTAAPGAATITGTAATLKFGRALQAASGTVAITGTDAALIHQTVGGYTLAATAGSVSITGADAGLRLSRRLVAQSGTYAITGTSASFARGFRLTAASGAYVITGTDASLSRARSLQAGTGSIVITGTSADLSWSGAGVTVGTIALPGSYTPSISLPGSVA